MTLKDKSENLHVDHSWYKGILKHNSADSANDQQRFTSALIMWLLVSSLSPTHMPPLPASLYLFGLSIWKSTCASIPSPSHLVPHLVMSKMFVSCLFHNKKTATSLLYFLLDSISILVKISLNQNSGIKGKSGTQHSYLVVELWS